MGHSFAAGRNASTLSVSAQVLDWCGVRYLDPRCGHRVNVVETPQRVRVLVSDGEGKLVPGETEIDAWVRIVDF